MKEIRTILNAYENTENTEKTALATVVRVEGSSYRRPGARMLVSENGTWVGGISGGCLEGDALRKAKLAILKDSPSLVTYDTTEDDAHQIGVGLGCNGIIDVLIAPLEDRDNNPLKILEQCIAGREANLLLTVTGLSGSSTPLEMGDMLHYTSEGHLHQQIGHEVLSKSLLEDIRRAQKTERCLSRSYELESGTIDFFIEYLPPALHLYLFGGNYDVFPMAQLAKDVGHIVTVVANPAKLSRSLYKLADNVLPKDAEIAIDRHTACILMAHDYKTDMNNLQKLLDTKVPYIGMLGPRKRTNKMLDELSKNDIHLSDQDQERLYSPVGLDIGATSPEEIALSILAEIRAFFADREGGFLKEREGTIHERV